MHKELNTMDPFKFFGTATVGAKGQIVIPVEARDELNIREGDKMIIARAPHGEGVVVLKSEMVEAMLSKMQSNFDAFAKSMKTIKESE